VHGSIYEFSRLPALAELTETVTRRPRRSPAVPLVGIVRNPRSHRNKGVAPEMEDCSNILTETPRTREDIAECLARFARRGIDYLVVDGGDGTVRDVLTCGAGIFGDDWPHMIVLPKGKTNALAVDLGLPNAWTLSEAMASARTGKTITRSPLRISAAEQPANSIMGFFMGAGVFTLCIEAGQEAHRRGAFNSFAVGITVLWAIIQAVFGRATNPWRARTRMRLADSETGAEVTHSGLGKASERYLALMTTFEKFPLGARPFGRNPGSGIKLATIDWPVRWLMLLLPVILLGVYGRLFARSGAIRAKAERLNLDLDGSFILDGEAFPPGQYLLDTGPAISFVVP
jgi:diacylglycerol kinase (ATP)